MKFKMLFKNDDNIVLESACDKELKIKKRIYQKKYLKR